MKLKRKIEEEIQIKQKMLFSYSLENTEARVPIIKEINKLKKELKELEILKSNWNYDQNLQILDSFLYLSDFVFLDNYVIEKEISINSYENFVNSYSYRKKYYDFFERLFLWLFSSFENSYMDKNFIINNNKILIRNEYLNLHLKSLKDLSEENLKNQFLGNIIVIRNMNEN